MTGAKGLRFDVVIFGRRFAGSLQVAIDLRWETHCATADTGKGRKPFSRWNVLLVGFDTSEGILPHLHVVVGPFSLLLATEKVLRGAP